MIRIRWRRLPLVLVVAGAILLIGPWYLLRAAWRAGRFVLTAPEELLERRRGQP